MTDIRPHVQNKFTKYNQEETSINSQNTSNHFSVQLKTNQSPESLYNAKGFTKKSVLTSSNRNYNNIILTTKGVELYDQ